MRALIPAFLLLLPAIALAQDSKVDFEREIQPIFRQSCYGCHGPAQQNNGLRMDRKSSAMKPGSRRIVPGSTENSFLFLRLKGNSVGPQMPPTGPLKPEQVALIGKWIDQGADWPDRLSNETAPPPLDPAAISMVQALRNGDSAAFRKLLEGNRALLNARGPEGSSPFQYAVIYAPVAQLAAFIKQGADVNHANDAKATPLMWAVDNLEKTRLLLSAGADVNAMSDDHRTPLMIAAGRPGNLPVVKLLLDRGAKTNPTSRPGNESSPLAEAALAGDFPIMQMLVSRGSDVKASAAIALAMSIANRCDPCIDLILAAKPPKEALTQALGDTGYEIQDHTLRKFIDLGADLNSPDPFGRTPLIYLAGSDLVRFDAVRLLVEHGANVNYQVKHPNSVDNGLNALDVARRRGHSQIVAYLEKAGAKPSGSAPPTPALTNRPNNTVASAVQASLPLLQKADAGFTNKAGCISCHNDSFGAMTISAARKNGFRVDESIAAKQRSIIAGMIDKTRDIMHQGFVFPVGGYFMPGVTAGILIGLHDEGYQADLGTDAAARYLKNTQHTDGHWEYGMSDQRTPICAEYISQTALAMRALQLYQLPTEKAAYLQAVDQAAAWIAKTKPLQNEDRAYKVMGLGWAGTQKQALQAAIHDLIAAQRPDGGWSDIPTMPSTAYSTGNSLVALRTAGVPASDPAFQKGIHYLLNTQQADGSWYVQSLAMAIQPYFDSGFSHGYDQYISVAATNWATLALTMAEKVQLASR